MTRPRLLDLFCGAGGATRGYQRAGFHVTGVDIAPQPHYCGDGFVQADALEVLAIITSGNFHEPIDAIHASPPCKRFTRTGWSFRFGYHANHEDLLTPTRTALKETGTPWVIENVPGAPVRPDLILCGSQFGLGVRRHRWFETSPQMFTLRPPCAHPDHVVTPLGNPNAARGNRHQWAEAMGIDWMTQADELAQAIPPAYTNEIGGLLMAHLRERAA